ncbi:MAG TPA: hypothetical protein PK409_08505 [Thermosynergistes sp.]|nr:hypothetical protein [Thermosynergistes sp.]HQE21958.1 hypothetical protein [Thermosynergistes sp.]
MASALFEVSSVFARRSVFCFSGSRNPGVASVVALRQAITFVQGQEGAKVLVGCASGVDAFVRSAFPRAVVFSVSSGKFGSGRSAFARRSVALVRACAASSGLFVSFPSAACPVGLAPSASASRCFAGYGSGSWSSLAFALGLGLPCVVFSPAPAPAWFGLVSLGGGWYLSESNQT